MSEQLHMNEGEIYMPVQERVTVFVGEGAIEPTDTYTDEEVLRASDEAQKPVEDPHVVCIDERESVEGRQPVREKVAGGGLMTGLAMAAAARWSGFTQKQLETGPETMAEEVADTLADNGEHLGAHRHSPLHGEGTTGCGAVDKQDNTYGNIEGHVLEEEFVVQAKIDLGDSFNLEHWQVAHAGFSEMAHSPKWQAFRKPRIQEIVEERGGVVEVLDGEKDAFKDPENKRHGHWGESARVNHQKGKSNDRDNATIPGFQVDVDPIVRMAKILATSEEEFSILLHAGVMFQYGTTYTLTRNMRILR